MRRPLARNDQNQDKEITFLRHQNDLIAAGNSFVDLLLAPLRGGGPSDHGFFMFCAGRCVVGPCRILPADGRRSIAGSFGWRG